MHPATPSDVCEQATSRCLITGCAGFIGSHLATHLHGTVGLEVYALARRQGPETLACGVKWIQADITDRRAVAEAVALSRPRWVFHLAARNNILESWADPASTFAVNVGGTFHLLEAVRVARLEPLPMVVLAGSSAEYGAVGSHELPIRENQPLRPSSPYGVSKATQDRLAESYGHAHGIPIIRVRPFHITGPGKVDVCAQFARALLALDDRKATLAVGNLEAVRDIVDIRDAVDALWLLAQHGTQGEAYNLCSGIGRTIRQVLGMFMDLTGMRPSVIQDRTRLRAADDPYLVGDNSQLVALGWHPRFSLKQTLLDILDYWRAHHHSLEHVEVADSRRANA